MSTNISSKCQFMIAAKSTESQTVNLPFNNYTEKRPLFEPVSLNFRKNSSLNTVLKQYKIYRAQRIELYQYANGIQTPSFCWRCFPVVVFY